jgi:hypothetical protein
MKKLIVFIALSMTCFLSANAQIGNQVQNFTNHPRSYTTRYSFWEETNFQGSIDSAQRWQYQVDYQQRRMADASWTKGDPGSNTSNIMKNPYQYVVRPWIHYWLVPKRVRLSLSPIGFWETYTPAIESAAYSNGDKQAKAPTVQPEFRICPQITFNNQIGRLLLVMRYRYEFRFQGNRMPQQTDFWGDLGEGYSFYPTGIGQSGHYGSTHAGRFRWQTRVQLLLNSNKMQANTVYINAWNELFISTGRHVDITKVMNQNRLVAMIGWKLPTAYPIRLEAGVTFQTNFVYAVNGNGYGGTYTTTGGAGSGPVLSGYTGSRQVENNVAYTVYLIFDEFHTLFKKKRPQDEPKFPHPEKL